MCEAHVDGCVWMGASGFKQVGGEPSGWLGTKMQAQASLAVKAGRVAVVWANSPFHARAVHAKSPRCSAPDQLTWHLESDPTPPQLSRPAGQVHTLGSSHGCVVPQSDCSTGPARAAQPPSAWQRQKHCSLLQPTLPLVANPSSWIAGGGSRHSRARSLRGTTKVRMNCGCNGSGCRLQTSCRQRCSGTQQATPANPVLHGSTSLQGEALAAHSVRLMWWSAYRTWCQCLEFSCGNRVDASGRIPLTPGTLIPVSARGEGFPLLHLVRSTPHNQLHREYG